MPQEISGTYCKKLLAVIWISNSTERPAFHVATLLSGSMTPILHFHPRDCGWWHWRLPRNGSLEKRFSRREDAQLSNLILLARSCVNLGMSLSLISQTRGQNLCLRMFFAAVSLRDSVTHSPLYQPWDSSPAPGSAGLPTKWPLSPTSGCVSHSSSLPQRQYIPEQMVRWTRKKNIQNAMKFICSHTLCPNFISSSWQRQDQACFPGQRCPEATWLVQGSELISAAGSLLLHLTELPYWGSQVSSAKEQQTFIRALRAHRHVQSWWTGSARGR